MIVAKVVSLGVRPVQVSLLCFEAGGVLGESFAELGATVSAFDFASLYQAFRKANLDQAVDPGRLPFDSDGIDTFVKGSKLQPPRNFVLATLRAETAKAALNKAINARANAVFTKYQKAQAIVNQMIQVASAKATLLSDLSAFSQKQTELIDAAYTADGRKGVVKTSNSVFTNSQQSSGNSTTTGPGKDESQQSKNTGSVTEQQTVVNTDFAYRVPELENLARNKRAQVSLADEILSNFVQGQNLEHLLDIFKNELASIDSDVNQLQIAYLNTILLSPINGMVTGVYKNAGEAVSPGEPVMRVENNAEIYFIAKIVCRGSISIGSRLQFKTALFDSQGSPVSLEAPVVAVRGGREDDQWEVIARRSNLDAAGNIIFPLGYSFDYDNTELKVLGAGEV